MPSPAQHPVTLRFRSDALEYAFRKEYVDQSLRQVRYALPLGIVIYGLVFGLVDYLSAPALAPTSWLIRGVVCSVTFAAFLFTYAPAFKRYMQPVLSSVMLLAGGGLILLLALDSSGENYYEGPVLIILPAYVVLRLRFAYASAVGWLLVAAYAVVAAGTASRPASELVSSLIFISSANVIGMFAGYMLEDYARRHFWQAQVIDEKRRENEELLEARSRFFANISHEFRTPLTLILGPLENMLREGDPPRDGAQRKRLRIMYRSAKRLLKLINELLDLARLESGDLQLRARKTAVASFVRGVAASFDNLADQKDIELQLDADEEAAAYVDRDKLEKVLVNLMANAFKFTSRGGTVRVAVRQAPETVQISVRDSGPGIPDEELPHIFDRFRQTGSATMRGQDGSGLGLALTKELVELHQGTIDVESEPGFGSEFIITLPRGRSHLGDDEVLEAVPEGDAGSQAAAGDGLATSGLQPRLAASGGEEAAETDCGQATVLVVEDNADVRAYVREGLGNAYDVAEAESGEEGLEKAHDLVPDLVVTDVIMPGMDGNAFCEALKADPVLDHVPVIVLTAKAEEEYRLEGLASGADAYLGKPFSRRELVARAENLLANRRRLQRRFSREALMRPAPVDVQSADERFIQRAREAVEAHMDDDHFNVDAFAEEMGMSRRQLQRKLRAVADETPSGFIRLLRLGRGAQLIEQDYGTIAEVAYAVGFSSPSYFTRCFRETFGATPSEYTS